MLGTLPASLLAPLDYRYALDAAMPVCARATNPVVLCGAPELLPEVRQRIPRQGRLPQSTVALWVEPLAETWRSDLALLNSLLVNHGQLVVIASRPLAAVLPNRWPSGRRALGVQPGGIHRLCGALSSMGLVVEASYGIHTMLAIALNFVGRQLERRGYPDMGDRLQFAARLRYCTASPLAALSTVGLLLAHKEQN